MAMAHNNCALQALILSTLVLLLACSTVAAAAVGTAETQPPSGGGDCRHYRFELTHVDANLNLSSDELMRRAYERSRLRAATLYGTGADDSPAAAGDGGSSDSDSGSPVRSPGSLSQRDSVYHIKFYLGNQLKYVINATVDTGSNLIWTTLSKCSTTRSLVPCSSDTCKQQAKSQCGTGSSCMYDITYGGDKGTQTRGILCKDTVTFLQPQPQIFKNIAIGCSDYVSDTSIEGIVGLGRGTQSLPGQLNFDKFSYCLNSYYKPDLPSYLLLTAAPNMGAGAASGAAVATTGLRRNDMHETRYFVDLQGISIGGTRLDVATKSGGNMFVDTGTSFTQLEESVFDALVEKIDQIMKDKQYSKEIKDGRICYSASATVHAGQSSVLPQMVLHFAPSTTVHADSPDMVLPSDSYFWKSSKPCLAIEKTKGISVLGNFQMQGIHMFFDTQNDKLSFVPADCTKV